jgi:anti-anti-sigma regulatory factor
MGGGFEVNREDVEGRVVLWLSGTLDVEAAEVLKKLLCDLDRDSDVVVDFSHVREFFDLSLSVLVSALAQRPVHLRGLRTHQARMFEYFGIPAGASERVYYTPEELVV